jgi:hypothetical protein
MSDAFRALQKAWYHRQTATVRLRKVLCRRSQRKVWLAPRGIHSFQDPRKGLVNKAFNEAYDEAYGKQPLGIALPAYDPDTKAPLNGAAWLKDHGVWNDYQNGENNFFKMLAEGPLRTAAAGMDAVMRTMYATARGAEAAPWWSPAHPIGAVASAALEGAFPELMPHLAPVAAAKDVGVIGGRAPENVAREALAPRGPSPTEVVLPNLETREATPAPATIHEAARQLEPDLFAQYDVLQDTKNQYHGMIQEALDSDLPKERVDQLRVEMNEVDAQLREIAPDVNKAYRQARDMVPEPPPIEPPFTETEVSATFGEQLPTPTFSVDVKPTEGGFDVNTREGTFFVKGEEEARRLLSQYGGASDANVFNLLQRRASIQADVARQLVAAGRPDLEARASGALVQAHYESRTARFGGALGSARDLYEKEAPSIATAEGRARGRLNLTDNAITLMKDADASTFVHETAHGWLEELQRDAQHEKAPPDLVADMESVRAWLGSKAQ